MAELGPGTATVPEEAEYALRLLEDTLMVFFDHYSIVLLGMDDDNILHKSLLKHFSQLKVDLEEYREKKIDASPELSIVTQSVALALQGTLRVHHICQMLRGETTECKMHDHAPPFYDLENFRIAAQLNLANGEGGVRDPLVEQLSSSDCQDLILRLGDLRKLIETQSMGDHYSSEQIRIGMLRQRFYNEIHALLNKNWPCCCGKSHDGKLGSCSKVMLRLQPIWIRDEAAFGEFDVILQHGNSYVDCHVRVGTDNETRSNSRPSSQEKQPLCCICQVPLENVCGLKLSVVATLKTPISISGFWIDDKISSKPISCDIPQDIFKKGKILQPKEKREFALGLMYTFLQLLNGPWLNHHWDSANISIVQFEVDNPSRSNLRSAYFSTFQRPENTRPCLGEQHNELHPVSDIVTLANFLLELELQDFPASPTLDQCLLTDLERARSLLETLKNALKIHGQSRPLFIQSMENCLNPVKYDLQSLDHPAWELYQKVINPLEKDFLSYLGLGATLHDLEKELGGSSSLPNTLLNTGRYAIQPRDILPLPPRILELDRWFERLQIDTLPYIIDIKGRGEVKIAILDTGIDPNHPLLKDKITTGDCWDFVSDLSNICDETGHGTYGASLLAKTAPHATIFCGRVWERRYEQENTSKLAAKAIRYAADVWNVDIIVMPFAFPELDMELDRAIKACRNEVLMFAPASNYADEDVGYPAFHQGVICIYSNKSYTAQSEFCKLGGEGEFNFSTIGEEVDALGPLMMRCRWIDRLELLSPPLLQLG